MIIGVDPGANGAVVMIDRFRKVFLCDFMDEDELVIFFKAFKPNTNVFLEKIPKFVAGNDKISLSAMCVLYGNYKYILGLCLAYQLAVTEVIPQRWQKEVCGKLPRMTYLERKRWLCFKAKELLNDKKLEKKVTLRNCDALLIALYGWEKRYASSK
jgi:hypothetical protein